MSRFTAVSLVALILLAGCGSGGGSLPNHLATGSSASPQLEKYAVPIVTDPTVESSARRPSGVHVENSYGGVPASVSIIDAPKFGPGSQVNLAITEVDAMSGGVAYPIVQFSPEVVVNVLNYQNIALALGANEIPAMQYDGVQYICDPSQSTVVYNGRTYPMVFGTFANRSFVPSTSAAAPSTNAPVSSTSAPAPSTSLAAPVASAAAPSASALVPLYFPAPVDATVTAPNFVIDFDTANWINLSNGVAQVGPQGGGTVWSQSAVIDGAVVNSQGLPVSGAVVVLYDANGNPVRATVSGSGGGFELHGFYAGSYSMVIYNTYAPQNADFTLYASGNDPVGPSIAGPSISVPAGYRILVGPIQD